MTTLTNNDKLEQFLSNHQSAKQRASVLRSMNIASTPLGENVLSLGDKRKWLALVDYWYDRVDKEKTEQKIKEILDSEKRK